MNLLFSSVYVFIAIIEVFLDVIGVIMYSNWVLRNLKWFLLYLTGEKKIRAIFYQIEIIIMFNIQHIVSLTAVN